MYLFMILRLIQIMQLFNVIANNIYSAKKSEGLECQNPI